MERACRIGGTAPAFRTVAARAAGAAIVAAAIVVCTSPLAATSIVPPADLGEMARQSDAVVLATAGPSAAEARGDMVFTVTEILVDVALSGDLPAGALAAVECPGGEAGGRTWAIPGSPRFREGGRYLLPLSRKGETGLWVPRLLAWGVLEEVDGAAEGMLLAPLPEAALTRSFPRPDSTVAEAPGTYREADLLAHLAEVLAGESRWDGSLALALPVEMEPAAPGGGAMPAGCSFFSSDGLNFRWPNFDSGGSITIYADETGEQSLEGGGFQQVVEALDIWMAIPDTRMNLVFGGPTKLTIGCSGGQDSQGNTIVFNDPCSDIADLENCGGVLAYGGPAYGGTHSFNGESWVTIGGWIVVVNNGVGCLGAGNVAILLAHELGHGLGFGHFSDSASLMDAYCCHAVNDTDRACARFAYPAIDPSNDRPQVSAGGNGALALARMSARIAGTATDDGIPASPGSLTTSWSRLAGPGPVIFGDPTALETTATFSEPGDYLLGLTASDGQLLRTASAAVAVDVWVGSKEDLSFRQGTGGYTGTSDTMLLENSPDTSSASATELSVDGDDPGGSGKDSQVLLRFDKVFGTGTGKVPAGSPIRSAWLELTTSNQGDGADLHRMLLDWSEADTWSDFGADGVQPGVEAASEPDAIVAAKGQTVRLDVTRSLAAWSLDPCENLGWVFLPRGDDGWDFSSSEGSGPLRLLVERLVVPEEKPAAIGDTWRYMKGRTSPPATWKDIGFNPAGWLSGRTGIGYGEGGEGTVLTDMKGSYLSIYCRREFTVQDPLRAGRLILSIDYDDGFIAYLNGVEAARSRSMGAPGSAVDRNTRAGSRESGSREIYLLDRAPLVEGTNVLAIEVHNSDLSSSDLEFIPELTVQEVLVDEGSEWRFLRGRAAPPAGWNSEAFDDSSWDAGPAGIGYGDGDDLTVLDDMRNGYLSVFCRTAFEVAVPGAHEQYLLTVICDDGFVAYLNGVEIARANMPSGTPKYSTAASSSVEATVKSVRVPASRLKAGRNVLAASVHNSALDSSDLSFVAVLVPVATAMPEIPCGTVLLFRRGDVTGEGTLNITDAIDILEHLFAGGAAPSCPDAADANDSGMVEISDAVRLLFHLFQGTAIPPPYGACGDDPTVDFLGLCSVPACGG